MINFLYWIKRIINENSSLYVSGAKTTIFDAQFLLEKDEKHMGVKPFRTNIGYKYNCEDLNSNFFFQHDWRKNCFKKFLGAK